MKCKTCGKDKAEYYIGSSIGDKERHIYSIIGTDTITAREVIPYCSCCIIAPAKKIVMLNMLDNDASNYCKECERTLARIIRKSEER